MDFRITFMNIGRNDGILITCDGEAAFIDAGMRSYGQKAVKYMKEQGISSLKYYIGTHAHKDHIGGGPAILAALPTQEVLIPHKKVETQMKKFGVTKAEKAAANAAKYTIVKPRDVFYLGTAKITCLGPIKIWNCAPGSTRENYNSLILRVDYGDTNFLLTADSMTSEYDAIMKTDYSELLKCLVVKNPHHNGKQPLKFLQRTQPKYYVFSTSKSAKVSTKNIKMVEKFGAKWFNTANKHITFYSNGNEITIG